ncbi:putative amidohydrolase YtcJ [Sphingopyxis panaciterrae]|uniref:amidohydrolase family protein n=1 Tax=Sphingopyxis panaciterrae TaxID=363841 RepID=UPI00141F44AB|nr:amidohydrolase family protein [Sphingopyxis panaciterrae]NIJ36792.1 putative amidohydrolase YtcJ [Sphingopyxis panaciterrae]
MNAAFDLLVRNARDLDGRSISVGIRRGIIAALDTSLTGTGLEIDAQGCILGPGLHDHHLHLLATAAQMASVDLADARSIDIIIAKLRAARPAPGGWVRATGYDERAAGLPDRDLLDAWLPDQPLRVQDRTGGYWILNSAGVAKLGEPPFPACVEQDVDGRPNGRIRRGDAWLRDRVGAAAPSLAALGARLVQWGVTGVTDAGAANGAEEAALLAGAMPQRLVMMGTESLPPGAGYRIGPLKLLFDEDDLPTVESAAARIAAARTLGRNVAAHCVTMGELLFYLEALAVGGGSRPGDRIEHGGVIADSLIGDIAAAGLTVVTQPNFIHDRGDRYLEQVAREELDDLYRLGSLQRRGVHVLGGSDAPYGDANPWIALRAATDRRTRGGDVIGAGEAIDRRAALQLYQATPLAVGAPADLILYDWPQDRDALASVHLTLIGGVIAWQS